MKSINWRIYLPYALVFLIVLLMFKLVYNAKTWQKEERVISSDIIIYYAYLPATFIYHDYTLKFTENYKGPHKFTIWYAKTPNDGKILITSMGMSMLYSPFFFLGHLYAKTHGFDAGGYSPPYSFALLMSCLFYVFIGLIYLVKLLALFYSRIVTMWVTVIIVFGTNLFVYSVYATPMSHAYSFSLIVIYIYYTLKWYKKPSVVSTLIIGVLLGLITLIRPVNIVACLFFLLWDIKTFIDIKNRFVLFLNKWHLLLIIILLCLLVWLPQMFYWKSITGNYLYYSYGETNKFFFAHPRILDGLFSYRNGWLVYSPVMIIALAGIPLLWYKFRPAFYSVLLIFIIHIYVIYSWFDWWYGGAFGSRPMIDIYGLLALPLGAFCTRILDLKKIRKIILLSISVLLLLAGIWHTHKFIKGSIHSYAMTKAAFWGSYFRSSASPNFWNQLEEPDYVKARKGIYEPLPKNKSTTPP